jgi:hypothetical protein
MFPALAVTTIKLRLVVLMDDDSYGPGNLTIISWYVCGWNEDRNEA